MKAVTRIRERTFLHFCAFVRRQDQPHINVVSPLP